ncbi:hypothetical protein N4G69_17705 [Streptomyces mirabilis]|uniref:hypothetical protein n=1 Tax=Streptomyces mirabilis TaxID=68239 RepID=UPI0021BEA455|nr:hypothetical protein [Streptomyces mirabilis]MCT9107452.1 hypothetical protein [Streptomyces mirabilis]
MTRLQRLERISGRMGGGRARLRCLLASARALRQDAPGTAQENLRAAVDLARSSSRPFETAVTLATTQNEELLAILIAEGLTSRQIATVPWLSEDAVAGGLSRLFACTGLRSSTEVVTSVLTGHRTRGQGS